MPRLDNLAISFRQMARGMELAGLSPVRFYALQGQALAGTITPGELAALIDEDYRNGEDGRGAAVVLFDALLRDAT